MHQPPRDSTTRFSNRVENYVRFRPTYPDGVIQILQQETSLTSAAVIADVGSGTGISSKLFLPGGNEVFGIEPNPEMRQAAETMLEGYSHFHSVAATAEATSLPTANVDYVIAGQAFHWFDRDLTRKEFARILRPAGWVVLIWNSRRTDSTPFLRDYESLLQEFGTDYREIQHKQIDPDMLRTFFAGGQFTSRSIFNEQKFDFDGLRGRLLSSSYAPTEEHPNYQPMIVKLKQLFETHKENNQICFEYDTELYFGRVA